MCRSPACRRDDYTVVIQVRPNPRLAKMHDRVEQGHLPATTASSAVTSLATATPGCSGSCHTTCHELRPHETSAPTALTAPDGGDNGHRIAVSGASSACSQQQPSAPGAVVGRRAPSLLGELQPLIVTDEAIDDRHVDVLRNPLPRQLVRSLRVILGLPGAH